MTELSGFFITFEGTDGCGKTTQIKLLENILKEKGYDVVCVREPGGTTIGEKVRQIIIDRDNSLMTPQTEALLYAACRAQLVSEVIIPALRDGKIVISDRFLDSNIVYQGLARGLGEDEILSINQRATVGLAPDITFFLKLSVEGSIKRKSNFKELDRLESEDFNFHQRVYDGYVYLSRKNADRIITIDAEKAPELIHEEILDILKGIMKDRGL
ncbi:MAG TPA: dTMP kinase [Lachnospiraceae bacterium]|nr:dTMP kinase [Lachnospiraceae bacterium]